MKKRIPETERQVITEEAWQMSMTAIETETHVIYEQASGIFDLKQIARLAGTRAARHELMDALRVINEATSDAIHKVALISAEVGDSDALIAEMTGLHQHTVRRWRESHEKHLKASGQSMTTEEVDHLTGRTR